MSPDYQRQCCSLRSSSSSVPARPSHQSTQAIHVTHASKNPFPRNTRDKRVCSPRVGGRSNSSKEERFIARPVDQRFSHIATLRPPPLPKLPSSRVFALRWGEDALGIRPTRKVPNAESRYPQLTSLVPLACSHTLTSQVISRIHYLLCGRLLLVVGLIEQEVGCQLLVLVAGEVSLDGLVAVEAEAA